MSASPAGGTPPGGRPGSSGTSHGINHKSKAFIQKRPPVKKYKPGEFPPGHPMYHKQFGQRSTPPTNDNGTNAPGQDVLSRPNQAQVTPAQALLAKAAQEAQAEAAQAQPGQAQPARAPQPNIFGDLPAVDRGTKFDEYSICLYKSTTADARRHHTMKFITKLDKDGNQIFTNPFDTVKFTRPVTLVRHSGQDEKQVKGGNDAASGVDDKEREIVSAKRAERQAQREANQAQIAPADNDEAKKAQKKRKIPKTQDIFYDDNTPAYKARAQLRHEEKKPWHLEDFDGKSKHVASYVEGLSHTKVMLILEEGVFRMVPVEKAYKFAPTGKFKPLTSEQAEAAMNKKFENPRWFMKTQDEKEVRAKAEADDKRREMKLKYGEDVYKDRMEEAREQARIKRERNDDSYRADRDELDFDAAGEFDDDDAGLVFGEDEAENKETEKRIREEQRNFNLPFTGLKEGDDKDWDAEERDEKLKNRAQRRAERKTKKRLMRREGNFNYQEDDDSDAKYDDSSDESSDSEFEDEKKTEDKKIKAEGSQSGSSTKGTNTPSGRPEKHGMSKSLGASLKRPGSPNLSDASSNGAGRKKIKVNGKDSDTDSNRASRPTKKTFKQNSPPGSPPSGSATASRAGSPAPRVMPTAADVKAAIPEEGIAMSELIAIFRPRLPTSENVTKDFITLVKQVAWQHPIKGKAKSASKLPKEAYDFQVEVRFEVDGKPRQFIWPLKHVVEESEESDEDEEEFVDAQEESDEDEEEFVDAQEGYSDVDEEVLVGDSGEKAEQKEYSDVDEEALVGNSGERGKQEQKKVTIKKGVNGKVNAKVSSEAAQPAKKLEQKAIKAPIENGIKGKPVTKVTTAATQPAKKKSVNKLLSPRITAEKAKLADEKTNATDATEATQNSKKRKVNDTETTESAKKRNTNAIEDSQPAVEDSQPASEVTQPAVEVAQPAKKPINKLLSPKITAEKAALAVKEKTQSTDAAEATTPANKRKMDDNETTESAKKRKVGESQNEEDTEVTPAKLRMIKKLKVTPKTAIQKAAEKEAEKEAEKAAKAARVGRLEDKEKSDLIEEARKAKEEQIEAARKAKAASDAQMAKKHKAPDDDQYKGSARKKVKPSPLSEVQTLSQDGESTTKTEPTRVFKKPLLKRPTPKDAAAKAKLPKSEPEISKALAKKADKLDKEKMDVIAEFANKSGGTSGESPDSLMTYY